MTSTLFFTSANQKYECFIAPYAASVLHHNPDAIVEFAVEDAGRARSEIGASLEILDRHFPDRVKLRSADFSRCKPNTVRFITEPQNPRDYTYIGDIDIIVLDHVTPMHLQNMAKTGLPYSNVLRKDIPALTGLHFTRSNAYYPLTLNPAWDLNETDELLLYKIIGSRQPMPSPETSFRPVHGIHISMNRRPVGKPGEAGWDIGPRTVGKFHALRQTPVWTELAPTFHRRFAMLLLLVQVASDSLYPELNGDADPRSEFVRLSRSILNSL